MFVRIGQAVASLLVGIATAVLILAVAIVPFVNPVWVSFEQGRARADAWTGYSPAQLRQATDAILSDLVVGPPNFDVVVGGQEVLNARERQHMRDVRAVFMGLAAFAAASLALLVVAYAAFRGSPSFWRPVRGGAAALAVGILVVGILATAAFDLTFEIFHRLFFAGGTYNFDPRTDRLVQLFPEQFWFESALAVGAVVLILCLAAWRLGTRRARTPADRPARAPATLEPSR